MNDPFAWLGTTVVRFRWAVLAVWLVLLTVAGGLLAPHTPKALKGMSSSTWAAPTACT